MIAEPTMLGTFDHASAARTSSGVAMPPSCQPVNVSSHPPM
jgi:hypothetical protein